MKAKVVTESGRTTIYLTPENSFDKIVMKNFYEDKQNSIASVDVTCNVSSYIHEYRMEISITQPTE